MMQKQKELFWSLCCDQKKEREKRPQSVDTTLAEKMEFQLVLISVFVTKVHHVQGVKIGLILASQTEFNDTKCWR